MGIPQKKTKTKTRRRLRDLDQIHTDIADQKHLLAHKNSKAPEDLPGLGEFYCVECAKWFESEHAMVTHRKGSTHKRQVKALKEEPYTQREAEAAIGIGAPDNGSKLAAKQNTKNVEVEMENSMVVEDTT